MSGNKKVKIMQIAFMIMVMSVMTAGLIRTLFFAKDINYYENRPAAKIEKLTSESFLSSDFQNSAEKAFADQVPASQTMKKLYNTVNSEILMSVIENESEKHPEEFFKYNGVYLHQGYILWEPFDFEECREEFNKTAESINKAVKNNPSTEFYLYYIENDSIIDFRIDEKIPIYKFVKEKLEIDDEHMARFEVTNFNQFKENFYHTDHHWNYKGSYKGYKEILKLLKCEDETSQPIREVQIPYLMTGSKAKESGLTKMQEYPVVYEFDFQNVGAPYGSQEQIINGEIEDFSYEMFYGVNLGEYQFDTGKSDLDNILIIGDSFDNAVLRLLAQHFNKTYSIDMRNLELPDGKHFNLTEYIKENNIDKVLFIASQVVFSSGEYIMES